MIYGCSENSVVIKYFNYATGKVQYSAPNSPQNFEIESIRHTFFTDLKLRPQDKRFKPLSKLTIWILRMCIRLNNLRPQLELYLCSDRKFCDQFGIIQSAIIISSFTKTILLYYYADIILTCQITCHQHMFVFIRCVTIK